jgi:hypothetical protein
MRARTVAVLAAACAVAAVPAVAETTSGGGAPASSAKPATKPAKKPVKKASSRKATKDKKRASTKKKRSRKIAQNMPRGWSWPPTKAMRAAGDACKKRLDELGVRWEPAKNEKGGKIVTPITVPAMELGGVRVVAAWRKPPHVMDCHLALGLATYGPALTAIGVRSITFSSIFRNTPVRAHGQTKNMLSRHALGLAIDVRAFSDSAGREAVVETDYAAADTLLLGVEQVINDSGGWRTVLTPRNDPDSHYDHFHLEIKVDYEHRTPAPAAVPGEFAPPTPSYGGSGSALAGAAVDSEPAPP